MNKDKLNEAVAVCKAEAKAALQTVYDTLNQGQQKKLLKNEAVKEYFDRFGVDYGGAE